MKKRTISMAGGYDLVVGTSGTRPPRASLRRLRRQIVSYLDHSDPAEWDDFAQQVEVAPAEAGWAQVELWKEILDRDIVWLGELHLARALVEAGETEKALEIAWEVQEERPGNVEACELIVKVMIFLGREYRDLRWVEVPKVAALDEKTLERCVRRISDKGAADAGDLLFELFSEEITLFEASELAEFLGADPRLDAEDEIVFLSG